MHKDIGSVLLRDVGFGVTARSSDFRVFCSLYSGFQRIFLSDAGGFLDGERVVTERSEG